MVYRCESKYLDLVNIRKSAGYKGKVEEPIGFSLIFNRLSFSGPVKALLFITYEDLEV